MYKNKDFWVGRIRVRGEYAKDTFYGIPKELKIFLEAI